MRPDTTTCTMRNLGRNLASAGRAAEAAGRIARVVRMAHEAMPSMDDVVRLA